MMSAISWAAKIFPPKIYLHTIHAVHMNNTDKHTNELEEFALLQLTLKKRLNFFEKAGVEAVSK